MKFKLIILFLSLSSAVFTSCNGNRSDEDKLISTDVINNPKSAQGESGKDKLPAINFKATEHDFGRVIEGEIVSYNFKFENSGSSNLLISSVSTSCGCAASDYPREPIKPGEEGVVKISFDSNNRKGFQNKTATVMTNTQPNKTTLRIKAMVVNPEN